MVEYTAENLLKNGKGMIGKGSLGNILGPELIKYAEAWAAENADLRAKIDEFLAFDAVIITDEEVERHKLLRAKARIGYAEQNRRDCR